MLIVTDGAVDLPETVAGSALVRRVPGEVWAAGSPFVGDAAEFWAALRKGNYPSTTPPTVSALVAAYQHPGLVVALHVSAQVSVTMARAKEAAARAGSGVVVIDTRSLSVGAGLLVTAVDRAARNPDAPQSLVEFARSLPDRLHTFAVVQDVEAVRRSDRASLLPSSHLVRNHPLVLAVRGRVVPLSQPRHRSAAVHELGRHLCRSAGGRLGGWALGHGDAVDVGSVVDRLSVALGMAPRFCTQLAPTVGAHLGPDSLVAGAISGPIDL